MTLDAQPEFALDPAPDLNAIAVAEAVERRHEHNSLLLSLAFDISNALAICGKHPALSEVMQGVLRFEIDRRRDLGLLEKLFESETVPGPQTSIRVETIEQLIDLGKLALNETQRAFAVARTCIALGLPDEPVKPSRRKRKDPAYGRKPRKAVTR